MIAAALALVAAVAAVGGLMVGLLVEEQPPSPPPWAEVVTTFGRAWFGLLPYVALAGLATVAASSSIAGMATAIGYFFAEYVVAGLLINLLDWSGGVTDYLLGRNAAAWMMGTGGRELEGFLGPAAPVGEFPAMPHAFLVLLAYTAVLVGLTLWSFRRKDIGGAVGT